MLLGHKALGLRTPLSAPNRSWSRGLDPPSPLPLQSTIDPTEPLLFFWNGTPYPLIRLPGPISKYPLSPTCEDSASCLFLVTWFVCIADRLNKQKPESFASLEAKVAAGRKRIMERSATSVPFCPICLRPVLFLPEPVSCLRHHFKSSSCPGPCSRIFPPPSHLPFWFIVVPSHSLPPLCPPLLV